MARADRTERNPRHVLFRPPPPSQEHAHTFRRETHSLLTNAEQREPIKCFSLNGTTNWKTPFTQTDNQLNAFHQYKRQLLKRFTTFYLILLFFSCRGRMMRLRWTTGKKMTFLLSSLRLGGISSSKKKIYDTVYLCFGLTHPVWGLLFSKREGEVSV